MNHPIYGFEPTHVIKWKSGIKSPCIRLTASEVDPGFDTYAYKTMFHVRHVTKDELQRKEAIVEPLEEQEEKEPEISHDKDKFVDGRAEDAERRRKEVLLRNMNAREVINFVDRTNPEVNRLCEIIEGK